jgi:hypothetical protein
MRRLQRYGLTASELERYIMAMMRDSAQLAEQGNSIPSLNSLDFVMESLALGHTVMSHGCVHQVLPGIEFCPGCCAARQCCLYQACAWF